MTKAKKKLIEEFDENGRPLCPKCHTNAHFKIDDYDLAPEDKAQFGRYKFVAICTECRTKITYYKDI